MIPRKWSINPIDKWDEMSLNVGMGIEGETQETSEMSLNVGMGIEGEDLGLLWFILVGDASIKSFKIHLKAKDSPIEG